MRIGLVSDTHGLVRPEALAALRGCEQIVHAGDIGSAAVLQAFARLAPVVAVRGNNDREPWAAAIPETLSLDLGGVRFFVLHDLGELALDPAREGFALVVSGHSHKPLVTEKDGVTYVNPGSAGPRRFKLPVSVAEVEIERGEAHARLVTLQV